MQNKVEERFKEICNLRMEALEKSIIVAKEAMEKRLEGMNEFRAQLTKQEAQFITRTEYEVKHQLILVKIETLQKLVYIGLGMLLILELLLRFLIK